MSNEPIRWDELFEALKNARGVSRFHLQWRVSEAFYKRLKAFQSPQERDDHNGPDVVIARLYGVNVVVDPHATDDWVLEPKPPHRVPNRDA
jgi:hypothetical protein